MSIVTPRLSGICLPQVNAAFLHRCSSGFDRYREEWLSYGCGQKVRLREESLLLGPLRNDAELQQSQWPYPSSENPNTQLHSPVVLWNSPSVPLDVPSPRWQDH